MPYSQAIGCLLALCVLTLSLGAQSPEDAVSVKTSVSPTRVRPGDKFEMEIFLELAKGIHINSNRPAQDFLIPTSLKFEATPDFNVRAVDYPKAEKHTYSYAPKGLDVYEGQVTLKAVAVANKSAKPGKSVIKAKLTYQPCNDQVCLKPEKTELSFPIEIIKAGQRKK